VLGSLLGARVGGLTCATFARSRNDVVHGVGGMAATWRSIASMSSVGVAAIRPILFLKYRQ
jgi:hypothetical protein